MGPESTSVRIFSPAKINLFLAVTGVREDGFHSLVSLVAPLGFGDWLELSWSAEGGADALECSEPEVPIADNLILKALAAFRQKHAFSGSIHCRLEKRIPMGAGLGGGSSNAAVTLRALNQMFGQPLSEALLLELAAELGSDCSLFLKQRPVLMRGRGEVIESLSEPALDVLRGLKILLFKPSFSINTAWAYRSMKKSASYYVPAEKAENIWEDWNKSPSLASLPLMNNLEDVSFNKYLALSVLLKELRSTFDIRCLMSGSGSSCFAILDKDVSVPDICRKIKHSWGEETFIESTELIDAAQGEFL